MGAATQLAGPGAEQRRRAQVFSEKEGPWKDFPLSEVGWGGEGTASSFHSSAGALATRRSSPTPRSDVTAP